MGISRSGTFDDVLESNYLSTVLSVSTSQVEAKVGVNRLSGRQELLLQNDSSITVYIGPSGVSSSGANKGIPLSSGEFLQVPIGENIALFMIAASGTASIIVQELA